MEREILKFGLGVVVASCGWLIKRATRRMDNLSRRQAQTRHDLEKLKRAVNILETEVGKSATVFD